MTNRPQFIDLRSQSHGPFGNGMPSPRSIPSPRLHVAGDVPPELSPLDAFAAQSRLLAKQLEECNNGGRRVSRLPPLTIASSLSQNQPGYFRSISAEASPLSPGAPESASKPEVETPVNRPISVYPTVSGLKDMGAMPPTPRLDTFVEDEEENRGRKPPNHIQNEGIFGARRDQSPPSLDQHPYFRSEVKPRPSIESIRQRGLLPGREHDNSLGISAYDSRALAPPRSPFSQRTPSPRSMSMESSDDDNSNFLNPPATSPGRKLSAGSGFSNSPLSPTMYCTRSPSISSEISVGGTRLPRPAFNFSRPLSGASMRGPPMDVPSRQASSDSQPSFVLADDTANTPISMHSEGFPDNSDNQPAPSYVYSKFSLPRGKMLQRNSLIFQEGMPHAQFSWEQQFSQSNVHTVGAAPPSPPSRPSSSSARVYGRPSLDPGRPSYEPNRPSLEPGRPLYERGAYSTNAIPTPPQRPMSSSEASSSTLKGTGTSLHSVVPADWSAEDNVDQAIKYHEAGNLTKSTYHLRLAARQHHPTGMLLYALACRHGWGMRPNQREGVEWLRKAADSASLEVAGDEDMIKEGKPVDFLEQKTRKAQFALSIYELGVSHMNGWGIEQDKALALRCFEIAGSWGDADALAEAGFCYAQGVGCKKNLKKSAKFYRAAEAKGISMIGNSWIYKSKYNDDTESSKTSFESRTGRPSTDKDRGKKRDKSQKRGFFGRKNTT